MSLGTSGPRNFSITELRRPRSRPRLTIKGEKAFKRLYVRIIEAESGKTIQHFEFIADPQKLYTLDNIRELLDRTIDWIDANCPGMEPREVQVGPNRFNYILEEPTLIAPDAMETEGH